jgi:hypothetical protein
VLNQHLQDYSFTNKNKFQINVYLLFTIDVLAMNVYFNMFSFVTAAIFHFTSYFITYIK